MMPLSNKRAKNLNLHKFGKKAFEHEREKRNNFTMNAVHNMEITCMMGSCTLKKRKTF